MLNVTDTVEALGLLANYYRRLADYKVIAITGSVGKTTTKNMIYHVLSRHFSCYKSPKSFNNNIGLPLTLLGAEANCEIVIAEIGSNHPGEISPLSIMAAPDVAAITNIYPTHLEGFGSIEAIIKEKVTIADGMKKSGLLLINGNFEQLKAYCNDKKLKLKTFDPAESSDIGPVNSKFFVEDVEMTLPLPGPANIENAVTANAVCGEFGITPKLFAEAIQNFKNSEMRLEILKIGPITVLNDCYNANPASMINALWTLKTLAEERNGRAVFVCGTMAELGSDSQKYHSQLGTKVVETEISLLLTAGDPAREIAKTAKKRTHSQVESECFDNTAQLCNNLAKFIKPDDIILVKASRSERFEAVVDKLKEVFSDR
jgi:UDP-N-acetylmuramoyl-tripeptide--D-alanyl-D-alanine ligase